MLLDTISLLQMGKYSPSVVNLIKQFTIVICPYYDSRVVIYNHKMFIKLGDLLDLGQLFKAFGNN